MLLKAVAFAVVSIAANICAIEEQIACTHGFLCRFVGTYEATGISFKKPARLAMRWAADLGGAFVRVDYRIDTSTSRTRERHDSVAYLKTGGVNHFVGTWLDSQGAIQPLDASAAGGTLTAFWGVRGKGAYGRTTYRLLDDRRVEVVDSVVDERGVWNEQSHNTLIKTE